MPNSSAKLATECVGCRPRRWPFWFRDLDALAGASSDEVGLELGNHREDFEWQAADGVVGVVNGTADVELDVLGGELVDDVFRVSKASSEPVELRDDACVALSAEHLVTIPRVQVASIVDTGGPRTAGSRSPGSRSPTARSPTSASSASPVLSSGRSTPRSEGRGRGFEGQSVATCALSSMPSFRSRQQRLRTGGWMLATSSAKSSSCRKRSASTATDRLVRDHLDSRFPNGRSLQDPITSS